MAGLLVMSLSMLPIDGGQIYSSFTLICAFVVARLSPKSCANAQRVARGREGVGVGGVVLAVWISHWRRDWLYRRVAV